jgi:peptidoglycan/xylan/chitin deacetylase (PgdA/CDA1 family)
MMGSLSIACLALLAAVSPAFILPRRWLFDLPYNHILWHGSRRSPRIAMTFDDGPHPVHTPAILDVLEDCGVKASFFVTGSRGETHPRILAQIHAKGHLIANHSYSHLKLPFHSRGRMRKEIEDTNRIIKQTTGTFPAYFRPPHGLRDPRLWNILKELHMVAVMWEVMPWDWKPISEYAIVRKLLHRVRNGSIITLHDGGGARTETVKAVQKSIPLLLKRGYDFVVVDDLMPDHKGYQ